MSDCCYQCKFSKHVRDVTDERVGFSVYECRNEKSEFYDETIPDIFPACELFIKEGAK